MTPPSDSAMKEAEKIFDRCYCYDLKDDPENWPCQTCRIALALDCFAEKATRQAIKSVLDYETDSWNRGMLERITNDILKDSGLDTKDNEIKP